MITYEKYANTYDLPDGFFEGWPNPPSKEKHRELLEKSYLSLVALDGTAIVGFVNVISDGVLSCYIPPARSASYIQKPRNRKRTYEKSSP